MNEVIAKGLLFESVGGHQIGDRDFEGNHVIATAHPRPLQMQINYLRAYASFYNPWNLLQAFRVRKKYLRRRHIFYQLWGMAVLVRTTWMLRGYLWQLWTGPIRRRRQWPDKFRRPGSPYTGLIETGQVAPGLETLDAPRQPISVSP